jgi:hypothetical protein
VNTPLPCILLLAHWPWYWAPSAHIKSPCPSFRPSLY